MFSNELLAEAAALQRKIIEGSITQFSIEFLQSVNEEHNILLGKFLEEYNNQDHDEEFQTAKLNVEKIFEEFTEGIKKMIGVLEKNCRCEEKINGILAIASCLRISLVVGTRTSNYEPSQHFLSSFCFALNELFIYEKLASKIQRFNGNPEYFDLWVEEIRSAFIENSYNSLQHYAIVKYSAIGMGRTLFVDYASNCPLQNSQVHSVLDGLSEIYLNSEGYFMHLEAFFDELATDEYWTQEESYRNLYLFLQDLFEIFFFKDSFRQRFEEFQDGDIRSKIILKIEENVREFIGGHPLTLLQICHLYQCLHYMNELNDKLRMDAPLYQGHENVVVSFEAPFVFLEVSLDYQFGHLSNQLYHGTSGNKRFVIDFDHTTAISYIHSSLVDEEVKNVIVRLTSREDLIAHFFAYVTDDPSRDNSLIVGSNSIEIILNNRFSIPT